MDLQVTFQIKMDLLQRIETKVVEIQALLEGPLSLRGRVNIYNSVGPFPMILMSHGGDISCIFPSEIFNVKCVLYY